jgi:hypothetical protein
LSEDRKLSLVRHPLRPAFSPARILAQIAALFAEAKADQPDLP